VHSITAVYNGDPNFLAGTSTVFTQHVNTADGPRVTQVQRFGFHAHPTTLVLTFNEALAPARAQDLQDDQIVGPGGSRVAIKSAVYDPVAHTVTLRPKSLLNVQKVYNLTVVGTGASGVSDLSGALLDGANNGKPGSNYVGRVTEANLVLRASVPDGPARLRQLHRAGARIGAHPLASPRVQQVRRL
jgi:hypothetical protein